MAAGCNDFVSKPYHSEEVFDCMARHLDLHLPVQGTGKNQKRRGFSFDLYTGRGADHRGF